MRRREGGIVSAPGGGGLRVRLWSWRRHDTSPSGLNINTQRSVCSPEWRRG